MTKSHRCCVLSRPWIKFQLRNLGFDHVAAGVPNGSWEHFNHRRLLHWTQISRQHCSRTKPCLTTIQLDSRHDYHAILSGSMVPHACNLLTRPGIQLMPLLVEMCKKSKKETNTSFQCLWASFWFLNRFAGAGEKVTAHSCGSHNSHASLKIRHSKISCLFDQLFLLETTIN